MRVDFNSRIAIGRVTIGNQSFPVYGTAEMIRQLRTVQDSVNAVESGLTALEVSFIPAGGIAATDVQAALEELDTEKATTAALTAGLAGKQNLDATLTALAALVTAADKLIYATGADAFALADLTAAGRAILDDADASAQRTTLGLGTIATQAANNVSITGGAIDATPIGATTPSTGKFSSVESTSYVKSASTVVASLPAAGTAGAGARHFVTDATATTFLSTVAGGGANKVPVVSDGTNWLIG